MRIVILGTSAHAQLLGRHLAELGAVLLEEGDPLPPYTELIIGIGDLETRRTLFCQHENAKWRSVIFRTAVIISPHGDAFQAMSNAFVQSGGVIGHNVLINTGAQIDHDCKIGSHCVIAPGAILCGGVTLGEACFVGAGAIIVEGVSLEPETFVPAGTLVVGPTDFRKPVRMVRHGGTDWAQIRTPGF